MFTAEITNFRAVAAAELRLGDGPVLLIGPNGAGKTSLANAVGALLCDLEKKQPYDAVKAHGCTEIVGPAATVSEVRLTSVEGGVVQEWPSGKRVEKGQPPHAGGIVTGLRDPFGLDRQTWLDLLGRLCALRPVTEEELRTALRQGGQPEHEIARTVQRWSDQTEEGRWNTMAELWSDEAADAKGAWRHITGEIWGVKKAEGWRPKTWRPELEGRTPEQVEIDLKDVAPQQAKLDELKEQQSGTRREVHERANVLREMPKGDAPQVCTCSKCGLRGWPTIINGGEYSLEPVEEIDPGALEARRVARREAEAKLEELALEESRLGAAVLEAEVALRTAREKLGDRDRDLVRQVTRAADKHAEALRNQAIAALFEPNGLRRVRLVTALPDLVRRLGEIAALLFERPIRITLDTTADAIPLMFDGQPLASLAWGGDWNSTVARLRYAVQLVAWERLGGDLVTLDRADILTAANRELLFNAVRRLGAPALIVMSSEHPERAAGLLAAGLVQRIYVLADGRVREMEAEKAEVAA